jgi:PAS domain S-box-containing protein
MIDESHKTRPELLAAVLDAMTDAVIAMDRDWNIISFNRAAEAMTGVQRGDALGRRCCDVLQSSICQCECPFQETLKTGKPTLTRAVYIQNADGRRIPISIATALLHDEQGELIGCVETIHDLSLVEALRKKLTSRYTRHDIVSKHHRIHQILDILPEVAVSDATVLIEGESGTGKDLLARAIHELSPRRSRPLVPVNCGALPDSLLESELFGYKSGAFTDARRDKPGRFALAEGGTLFLDEIGDITPALQARLLQVLQEKTYEPLGATRSERANVRIVAATNKNLHALVQRGAFREDLYYRINVVRLALPPLRDRREDIPLLVEHFIGHFNRLRGKTIEGADEAAIAALMAHDWPGNVRELEHAIEHAFILCPQGRILPSHLPPLFQSREPKVAPVATLKDAEKNLLLSVLERNHWNRLAAARELGIHKSTLFRKIHALGIVLPGVDGRNRASESSHGDA